MNSRSLSPEKIRRAFNDIDPASLLESGFPENEYDPEVNDILDRVSAGEPLTPQLIREVLMHWFHRADDDKVQGIFQRLAAD